SKKMTTPFPFDLLLVFGFLSVMLLIGVIFRAWITFFQKLLFPSSLIGGLLGLALINAGVFPLDPEIIKAFAYHFFNISFISVGLTPAIKDKLKQSKGKKIFKGSLWMALVQAVSFPMQAIIGSVIVMFFILGGEELFETFGFLLPLAFNEGPGQALSFGKVWETAGFADASTIGLTFATLGFFFAFFVGVPLANRGLKKEQYKTKPMPPFLLKGILPKGDSPKTAGSLTTHSGSLDGLTFHIAQIGFVYLVTYFFLSFLSGLLHGDAGSMIWGFFFIFGLIIAIVIRRLFQATPYSHLLNPPLQRRITGFSVDYLIVATGCGIELVVVGRHLAPVILIALAGGILTTLIVFLFGSKLSDYKLERTVAIYGVVTGTVSTGLMLLRIVDPEFKTPVAREIGFMNVFALPIVGGLTVLLNAPLWWDWSLLVTCLVLGLILLAALVILLLRRFWRYKNSEP
ncbi:MAG: sodium/glutamate symporter, partial [Bacteroidales bacterium]